MKSRVLFLLPLQLATLLAGVAQAAVNYVNWENHPIHALDLSPDGNTLAVAHTADARVQFFDVSTGRAVYAGSVLAGLDPVAVRFRTAAELWVVNHVSDSIGIIDVPGRRLVATIGTGDEPFDVVFAGNPQRAFVSASQINTLEVYDPANRAAPPQSIKLDAEDPRSLAVSYDGLTVYAAIFESGNATTIVAGATEVGDFPPNATRESNSPYGGVNPIPNAGNGFSPMLNPALPEPPGVGQLVRKNSAGRWMDDNNGDWTAFVSGASASRSGRVAGWDMPDRDIAVIDTRSLAVSWISGLMNIGMALAVNPDSGALHLVGTDATNEVRFEPNVNGTFVRVRSARVSAGQTTVVDLNPQLDYATPRVSQAIRDLALGDPRGIVWRADGSAGYVVGLGSNNVITLTAEGRRNASLPPIEVGEGPAGIAISADQDQLYVWNHFEAALSVIDLDEQREVQRLAAFSPLPESIRAGRRHFYDTHTTSGLGQASCASCHVDGRTDRLAWDLGDPAGELKDFNQNCASSFVGALCTAFHPLKGPMTTQTLQDIVGHEPLHWRGDRDGLEEFNPAFVGLLGDDTQLSAGQMQQFENFLATITIPPNPFRTLTNGLDTRVDLTGHFTSGRFGPAGQPLGTGNALTGQNLFRNERLDLLPAFANAETSCAACHTLPTGMGSNGVLNDPFIGARIGGRSIPPGPNGENHLHVQGESTLNGGTFKVPQLRNLHEKTGFSLRTASSRAGFGFTHDGAVSTLSEFVALEEFALQSDQEVADMVAFLLSFSGAAGSTPNAGHPGQVPTGLSSHAATGVQLTALQAPLPARVADLQALADGGSVELVVNGTSGGWWYSGGVFVPDDGGPSVGLATLAAQVSPAQPLTFTVVPAGLGQRLGLDRDGDGVFNRVEVRQGSDPTDANSASLSPSQGLWYNRARQGHGVDLQRAGDLLAGTWYTYRDDGSPVWYQAVGEFSGDSWTADLLSYTLTADGVLTGTQVGTLGFDFDDASHATFNWTLGERSGSEPFERFAFSDARTLRQNSGLWFDPGEPGYGLSIDTLGAVRVVVAYFYDANDQPRWAIGQSDNDAGSEMQMLSVNGFCPDCEFVPTQVGPGGTLRVDFAQDERVTALNMTVDYPGLADSQFMRAATLAPLTDVPINFEK